VKLVLTNLWKCILVRNSVNNKITLENLNNDQYHIVFDEDKF